MSPKSLVALKQFTQLVKRLLEDEGLEAYGPGSDWKHLNSGLEVVFDACESATYVRVRRPRVPPVMGHMTSVDYSMTVTSDFTDIINYKLCKNTSWGYVILPIVTFGEWFDALKFSLRQSDDLLVLRHIRAQQQMALDDTQKKLSGYDEQIAALKKEQATANVAAAVKRDLELSRPSSHPAPGPVRGNPPTKQQPYPVIVSLKNPPLKRASKGPPARNLRPRVKK